MDNLTRFQSFFSGYAAWSSDVKNQTLFDSLYRFLCLPIIRDRFLEAPASTAVRFHHAYPGGLFDHSVEVFDIMRALVTAGRTLPAVRDETLPADWSLEGYLAQMAFLHDLAKIGDVTGRRFYVPNMLKSGKVSDAIPYETQCPYWSPVEMPFSEHSGLVEQGYRYLPEGLRSLMLVRAADSAFYATLPEFVTQAILFHDGAYGNGRRDLAGKESFAQILLHASDMLSSRFPLTK